MTSKEDLLQHFRACAEQLEDLTVQVANVDIFRPDGYVDTEFFSEALEHLLTYIEVSNQLESALMHMLAPHVVEDVKKKTEDEGKQWSVDEILRHCTLEDNVLKLPNVQFNRKSYAEAKKWIEEAGGKWEGGKVQGFTFPFDAQRVFGILNEGKRCNLQQEFQFFETPPEVADWLVMVAGGISPDDTVLEPSAGQGGLVKAIHRAAPDVVVDCYELMPENKEILSRMDNINILGDDFTTECDKTYDKIIANPPFAKNQDVRHVRKMYDHLNPGGTVAAITSAHWEIASECECVDFRNWLSDLQAQIYDISEGEFKSSGTGIRTKAVVINK